MASSNWTVIEDAISAWVRKGSGLDDSHVLWSQQNVARPSSPWISLNMLNIEQLGIDWNQHVANPSSNGHDGHEILVFTRGVRRATLSIQCFGGDAFGDRSAIGIIQDVVGDAYTKATRAALNAAKVGLTVFTPTRSIGQMVQSTKFEPRAVTEVTMYLTSEIQTVTGIIQNVKVTPNLDNADLPEIDVSVPGQ